MNDTQRELVRMIRTHQPGITVGNAFQAFAMAYRWVRGAPGNLPAIEAFTHEWNAAPHGKVALREARITFTEAGEHWNVWITRSEENPDVWAAIEAHCGEIRTLHRNIEGEHATTYYKTDLTLAWDDGFSYTLRPDIYYAWDGVANQVGRYWATHAGLLRPAHATQEQYDRYLAFVGRDESGDPSVWKHYLARYDLGTFILPD